MRLESFWFSDQPDPALGAALRAALGPRDDGAVFVARVCARAVAAGVGTWRAVLERWSRVAVAAAVLLALVGGYLVGSGRQGAASFDTVWVTSAIGSQAAADLLAVHHAPDPSTLFATMVAN